MTNYADIAFQLLVMYHLYNGSESPSPLRDTAEALSLLMWLAYLLMRYRLVHYTNIDAASLKEVSQVLFLIRVSN